MVILCYCAAVLSVIVQPCCLEWYKQMDEKTALLDAAIATWDGNCITKVLLFIRKTLEFSK